MLVRTLFQKSGQFLSDLLYPPGCINCKTSKDWLCQACLRKILFITTAVCNRCGTPLLTGDRPRCEQCDRAPLQFIDGIRTAALFEDNPIRPAIHSFKYRNHKALAAVLGQILVEAYQRHNLAVDMVVPVPLHTSRLKERGYNQSQLLAKQVGNGSNLPVDTGTLLRIRKTRSQMELGVDERLQNVVNAFSCRNKKLAGRKVLVVDDVCTTGATLDACAAALKESGVTAVWGLALARARYKDPSNVRAGDFVVNS